MPETNNKRLPRIVLGMYRRGTYEEIVPGETYLFKIKRPIRVSSGTDVDVKVDGMDGIVSVVSRNSAGLVCLLILDTPAAIQEQRRRNGLDHTEQMWRGGIPPYRGPRACARYENGDDLGVRIARFSHRDVELQARERVD